jgi:hypothetical protein
LANAGYFLGGGELFSKTAQIPPVNFNSHQVFYDSQIAIKSTIITSAPISRLYRIYNLAQLPLKLFSTSHHHITVHVRSPRISKLLPSGFPLSAIRSAASKSDVPVQPSTCHIMVPEPFASPDEKGLEMEIRGKFGIFLSIKQSRFVFFH